MLQKRAKFSRSVFGNNKSVTEKVFFGEAGENGGEEKQREKLERAWKKRLKGRGREMNRKIR